MNIDYSEIYQNINLSFAFGGGLLKLFITLILIAIIFYSLMFLLKVRVLQDTVELSPSSFTKTLLTINLLISLIGALLSFVLILV